MPSRRHHPRALVACGVALLMGPFALATTPSASAAPPRVTDPLTVTPLAGSLTSGKLKGGLDRVAAGRRSVFVQLSGRGAAAVADSTLQSGRRTTTAARTASRSEERR